MPVSVATMPETRPPAGAGTRRTEVLGLAALPSAVPAAWHFARALLGAWEVGEARRWACQQVVAEFAGDALAAARGTAMLTVRFRLCARYLVVEVHDDGSGWSRAAPDGSGRGLPPIGSLASEWGVYAQAGGRVAWAAWGLAESTGFASDANPADLPSAEGLMDPVTPHNW